MKRTSGVLLPIFSLPSKYGIGCFDQAAYDFVDWLAKAGQTYWQILPLGATSHAGAYDSPYQAYSAFAGNPYFISLDALVKEGVLTEEECETVNFGADPQKVDYQALYENRLPLLHKAYERSNVYHDETYQKFCKENFWWLDDYALFIAVKEFFGGIAWQDWPEDIRMHYDFAVDYYREKLYFDVEFHKYLQFKFRQQWSALKKYANDHGILIFGDLPIYVSPDGSDVWAQPELFQLNEENVMTQVAGVPPDGFTADGQLWGNPLYRWDYHRETGYHWWVTRMWYSYELYDVVRIDHFRGFDEYFAIPAGETTAKNGHWEKGPGMELFYTLQEQLGEKATIAEDLGVITDGVRRLVRDSGFPNMKVLQFAFDRDDLGGSNDYLPHNYNNNCVVYTGTHDNATVNGWFLEMSKEDKNVIRTYLDDFHTANKWMYKKLVTVAMSSAANACVIPMQDWLGLDNTARMNTPGTVGVNWNWRMLSGQTTDELAMDVRTVTQRYGRANWTALHYAEKTQETAETDE